MHVFAGVLGLAIIAIILGDAFETIILPRRVTRKFRLTRLFYRYSWLLWRALCRPIRTRKRREAYLSFFGPLSLLLLLVLWAVVMILGFAMLQWAFGSAILNSEGQSAGFAVDLYTSGTTFFTLGLGDEHPASSMARFLMVCEAGLGLGFLAIVIGYLPVVYQAFSRREANITLLDARAGSPPSAVEMLRRYAEAHALGELPHLLQDWERWSAELLESHISYPVLAMFRSQHANESWVASLTVIMDVCSLLILGIGGTPSRQAQLTFAMARHAAVDLAQVMGTPPSAPLPDRLAHADFEHLRELLGRNGVQFRHATAGEAQLQEIRSMYEPYVNALANYLLLDLPSWFVSEPRPDNWQTSAWERRARRIRLEQFESADDHL